MKNFKLLLATAVLFAVGSAFTSVNKHDDRPVYGYNSGTWVLADGNDRCEDSEEPACKALMHNDDPGQGVEQILEEGTFIQVP